MSASKLDQEANAEEEKNFFSASIKNEEETLYECKPFII